jgi:hypothetical protein
MPVSLVSLILKGFSKEDGKNRKVYALNDVKVADCNYQNGLGKRPVRPTTWEMELSLRWL